MSSLRVCNLGLIGYSEAFELQRRLVEERKHGRIPNQLLFVEHPHVITIGRNGSDSNVLASREILERSGIGFFETDRGGDVTYHGPGQIVAYPIFDLREWKRDVVAFVRALEQVVIDTLSHFDIKGQRDAAGTGVWVSGAKVCAIGVHISRWVTSHGLALNLSTDLRYFQYIVPCGLTKPVTSMRVLGSSAGRSEVENQLARRFAAHFGLGPIEPGPIELLDTAMLTERVT